MPAIMIRPAVGSSEKVSGRIRATPATGPRPGSTPIAVPANAPTKAASKLAGVAATLNPYSRPWREFISCPYENETLLGLAAAAKELRSLSRLRGRAGVGVSPRKDSPRGETPTRRFAPT